MRTTLQNIGDYVQRVFLSSSTVDSHTCWVLVDTREDGLDLALHMTKQFLKTFGSKDAEPTVPHDSLPIHVGFNQENGRAAFIMSQPNHIPTVQTTMGQALAQVRKRLVSPEERTYAKLRGADVGKDKLLVDATGTPFVKPEGPDLLIVDQEYPMWSELTRVIKDDTEILLSDNVKDRKMKSATSETRQHTPQD